jgi:small subunit ribosomal protein S21
MKIYVRNNDINKALRVLKKKLYDEGDVKELRQRQHFVSPGETRRLAERAGAKRWVKKRQQIEKRMVMAERKLTQRNKKKPYSNQSKTDLANR